MYATVRVCMCSCICACVCVCSGLSSAEIRKKEKRSFRLTSLATRVGSLGNRKRERERESKKGVELREGGWWRQCQPMITLESMVLSTFNFNSKPQPLTLRTTQYVRLGQFNTSPSTQGRPKNRQKRRRREEFQTLFLLSRGCRRKGGGISAVPLMN